MHQDVEHRIRTALRTVKLEPPIRADLEARVRRLANRRRRVRQAAASAVAAAAVAITVVVVPAVVGGDGDGGRVGAATGCSPSAVFASDETRHVALTPGQTVEISVLLGHDLTFTTNVTGDSCIVRLKLVSESELLVSRTVVFPASETLIAGAAKLGTERATVTAAVCASSALTSCGEPYPLGDIVVHIVSNASSGSVPST